MVKREKSDGLIYMKYSFEKWESGRHKGKNKWEEFPFQKPVFPLIEDHIFSDMIHAYWKDKPVRFAPYNNCVGCFHRNPVFLKKMYETQPNKMAWFEKQEVGRVKGTWRSDVRYEKIRESKLQLELDFKFSACDSGFCEM